MDEVTAEGVNAFKQEPIVFRGKNFNIFKLRIQAKLRSKGLWKIVNGEETAASDTGFDSKEAKAFDLLVNALDDDNLAYVAHVGTSSEVWKLLTDRYEARTYADVSHVVHELHTKTYTAASSMQGHITEMRALQQKLLFMGTRIDDDMLGRIILTSVKEVFPTTVEILRNREPPPTLQQVIDRLLSKENEEARSIHKRKAPVEDQVLYTSKAERKPWKQRVKDKCLYCHKLGHHVAECRFKKRDLAKGIQRKCMPIEDQEINVLEHTDEEGFILMTNLGCSNLSDYWILDSACTADVSGDKTFFTKLSRNGQATLKMANDDTIKSTQCGPVSIQVDQDQVLTRDQVMYVPGLTKNMLSLRKLLQDGFKIAKWTFDSAVLIKNTLALKFHVQHGLYVLHVEQGQVNAFTVRKELPKIVLWHLRLAHLNFGAIKKAAQDGVVEGLKLSPSDYNQSFSCELAKAKRMSYKQTHPYRAQVPLERVHIDKGGPISPPTFSDKIHYELYVDEASRYKWLFLLNTKSETLANFKNFHVYAERQFGYQVKTIMTDNAKEYLDKNLKAYCASLGIDSSSPTVTHPKKIASPRSRTTRS